MSYMTTSGVVIVKTNLQEKDFNKLQRVHFEKDNIGYGIEMNEKNLGYLWWINNFNFRFQVNLKQESIEFFRKDSMLIFLISSKTFLSRLKIVLQEIFGEKVEVEILKHPILSNMTQLKDEIELFVLRELSLDKVFLEVSDYVGITIGFKKNEKQYILKYLSDGTISFGLGKKAEEVALFVDFIPKLHEHIVMLDLKRN